MFQSLQWKNSIQIFRLLPMLPFDSWRRLLARKLHIDGWETFIGEIAKWQRTNLEQDEGWSVPDIKKNIYQTCENIKNLCNKFSQCYYGLNVSATLAADPKISLIIIRFNLYGNKLLPFEGEHSPRTTERFFFVISIDFSNITIWISGCDIKRIAMICFYGLLDWELRPGMEADGKNVSFVKVQCLILVVICLVWKDYVVSPEESKTVKWDPNSVICLSRWQKPLSAKNLNSFVSFYPLIRSVRLHST